MASASSNRTGKNKTTMDEFNAQATYSSRIQGVGSVRRYVAALLIIVGVIGLLAIAYTNSRYSTVTRTFSPYTLLTSSWEKYKKQFIHVDGRVVDALQEGITTSEGQSYAMLRSVWVDDKEVFDRVWKWTKENLRRPEDNLFGWRWGRRRDETFGFLEQGGDNAASDADSDIALALILASKRWSDVSYEEEAKQILNDMWEIETDEILGKRYLVAGNWAIGEEKIIVNPSYFAPYAWRIFASVDREHDWESLIDPAYEVLTSASQAKLDKEKGVGLPPDWVAIERINGNLSATNLENLTTNYSYDALRIPWRIAVDYKWNNEKHARDYLASSFQALVDSYKREKKLVEQYAHDGVSLSQRESPTMYATSLSFLQYTDEALAREIYEQKIIALYSNDENTFDTTLPYYDQNWLWFGAALFNNQFILPFE